MIDFSTLVLEPAMATFGRVVTIDPLDSQPGKPPYDARAVYSSRQIDVMSQDGAVLSDQQTTLGIRLADFEVPPKPRDKCTVDQVDGTFIIDDQHFDGQGGATLTLRKVSPDYPR